MRYSVELNSNAIASLPDDTAGQLQSVIRDDQGEGPFDWNVVDGVGKLDRRTCEGEIADYARVFVTAVLRHGWLVNLVSRSNPGSTMGNKPGATSRRVLRGHEFSVSGVVAGHCRKISPAVGWQLRCRKSANKGGQRGGTSLILIPILKKSWAWHRR
jgi:hypothetical protein